MELVIMGSISLSSIVEAVVAFPWIRMGVIFGFFYLVLCVWGLLFADKLLFPAPSNPTYEKDENIGFLTTPGGHQIAYKIWKPSAESKGTILYSHGNGEDLGMIGNAISPLVEEGYTCVSYDYPGYGHSSGKPSEQGCYEAIDAVFTKLIQDDEIYKNQIVLWGRSLGTGPSCYLAAREKVAGLLLETPFITAFRTATEIPIVPWDRFPSINRAPHIKTESLVIHGCEDEIVPFRHGKKLFEHLPEPKSFLEITDANHNDLPEIGGQKYRLAINKFLKSVLKNSENPSSTL